jgi:murein DD-endopeptidase MepM/ murein hydrolase activator NlpD
MRRIPLLVFASLALFPLSVSALEVRFHPGDAVYPYEVDPDRGLSTVVLQQIVVLQRSTEPGAVTVESLEIQVLGAGQVRQVLFVPAADLDRSAEKLAKLSAAGLLKAYDFQLQTSRSLGEGIRVATGRTLAPGSGLIVMGRALLLSGATDQITVVAHGKDAQGQAVEARSSIAVKPFQSANRYVFPLNGAVFVGAAPTLHSHHRWAINQEFALDLLALGGDGRTHKGQGARLDDYYAYGREVVAVAPGTVVESASDATEANDRLRQPGESPAAFLQRTIAAQNELLARSPKAPLGNYVVICHEGNECSVYAHLKQGSVRVKTGDRVRQGQVIAQLGQTGNTTEPHLHFQLMNGPDPMYSRGLPITFQNIEADESYRQVQTGSLVVTK